MKTVPNKDVDFNVWQKTIAETSKNNVSKWGLDSAWVDELMEKKQVWDEAYEAWEDPVTRTTLITFRKTEARAAYEAMLRILVKNLECNTRVTDDDRKAVNIVIPSKTRTPVKVPTTFPDFTTDSSVIRCLTVHFRDHGSSSKAKPNGVHGAEIRWSILDEAPDDVEMLSNSNFDTHTPFTLQFKENERGKTVWFCLRWENTRGEKGPWSEIENAIIP